MNLRDIRILYIREIRSALRDRSIVTSSILVPILLYPLILWLAYTAFTFVSGQSADLKSRVALKNVPAVHSLLQQQLRSDPKIELRTAQDPQSDIRNGKLDAMVEFLPSESPSTIDSNFMARITYDESRDRSGTAESRIEDKILEYRKKTLEQRAGKLGITRAAYQNFWVDSENISSNIQMAQFFLGLMLPTFLLVMLSTGAMHPAIDSTAGERENSTWETVMTLATDRSNLLVSKYLYVTTMSFVAGLLNLIAMIFSLRKMLAPLFRRSGTDLSLSIPWGSIPIILLGSLMMALLVSACMMILASFARTFKEGQAMVSPFYVVLMVPLIFLSTPGTEFTTKLALIPVVNVTMMFREAIQGLYHWRLIGITVATEVACIAVALFIATIMVRFEDVVTGSFSGSFVKFATERILRRGPSHK
ncbi:MAG TPA: ABC transporter permease [Terriglobia bacterium]|nr:ABC transporter permease [Terriglobia bacterium]